jgi:hypothetical protein
MSTEDSIPFISIGIFLVSFGVFAFSMWSIGREEWLIMSENKSSELKAAYVNVAIISAVVMFATWLVRYKTATGIWSFEGIKF